MKAIKVKNEIYELTGERGDFWIAKDSKGKAKMFAKNEVEVIEVEKIEKPKFKKVVKKEVSAEQIAKGTINHIKDWLPTVVGNNKGFDFILDVKNASTNEIAVGVCETVLKFRRISEKQAYVIARSAVENNIEFNVNNFNL